MLIGACDSDVCAQIGASGMAAYSMSKAGVIGFVKAAGKEYAETNITINGLAPAVVRTQMVADMEPEQVKYMTDKIPMKRCTLACALILGLLLPATRPPMWQRARFAAVLSVHQQGARLIAC